MLLYQAHAQICSHHFIVTTPAGDLKSKIQKHMSMVFIDKKG